MQAVRHRYYADRKDVTDLLNATLDLVAVATVADVVPLVSENRTLVKYGLKAINTGSRPAFMKLAARIGLNPGEITSYHIAFGIAPHINAAGRMESATAAVKLFLTEDEAEADELVEELIRRNTERRETQDRIYEECKLLVDEHFANNNFLLVRPTTAHEGVAGIVAGKIKSRYGLPSAVLSAPPESPGILKGSARSIQGVDLTELLRKHGDLFVKLGGHAMAAGFSIPEENEEALRMALNDEINALLEIRPDLLNQGSHCEISLAPEEITSALALLMDRFEPTGTENPKPLIELKLTQITNVKVMGASGKHLRFNAGGVECVLFGYEEAVEVARSKGRMDAAELTEGMSVKLSGTLGINWWNGTGKAQFIVEDVLGAA
jgi:single-stranded-DNA-specific exonuclease